MSTAKNRNKERLPGMWTHLKYEIDMFVYSANQLASSELSDPDKNAFLESFVIHMRALLDFFYPKVKPHPDDVLAKDYFDDMDFWNSICPHRSMYLKDCHKRVGKEVAHLSYQRLTVTDKNWRYGDIVEEVRAVINVFVNSAPKSLLGVKQEGG